MKLLTHSPVSSLTLCSPVNHPLWILLLWLRCRPLTHRFERYSPLHPLLWSWKLSHWLMLTPHSTVTRPQEHNALLSHWHGDARYSTCFTVCLIQESERPKSSSLPDSYGLVSIPMYVTGLALAYSVNVPKFSDTPPPHSRPSQPPMLVLMSSTLTWLDFFHHYEDSRIC